MYFYSDFLVESHVAMHHQLVNDDDHHDNSILAFFILYF